ncbi:MAG: hypothetical protein IPH30_13905 [Betaproteobacteria bacterium]|nr:hypothetical protein [Betaproteobacteria bacterium]
MVSVSTFACATALPRRALAQCALAMALSLLAGAAVGAKNTPFGMELIPAHFPDSTNQDAIDALELSAQVGGHSSFVWHWSDRFAFDAIPSLVSGMRHAGLKSFIQIGAIFLNAPGPPDGYVKSFGDTQTRILYLNDVAAIARTKPDYMVFATEINLLHRFNPAEFQKFRALYSLAAMTVRSISPETKVGLSFLYSLWYFNYEIEKVDVPSMFWPLDFIAFTTYPEWLVREGHYASIADIPPEFHGAARAAYPNARIVFSEVGWASKVQGTPEEQAEFVRNIPRMFSTARPELVTWAVMHDMEFYNRSLLNEESTRFLESLGVDIDALFGHFNAMGLRDGYGNPKPAWFDALGMEFPPP